MSSLSLYICFVLLFLGISKNFSSHEIGTLFINQEKDLTLQFTKSPLSLVLIDYFHTGHLIKTYYHRYKIIYDYRIPETILVRTSKPFYQENTEHIGLSIFRRYSDKEVEFTPIPPSLPFIGNPSYGQWKMDSMGNKHWNFYRSYHHLNFLLGPPGFEVTWRFYQIVESHNKQKRPFFGSHSEFGTNGSLTPKIFPDFYNKKQNAQLSLKQFLQKTFDFPKEGLI